MVGDSDYGVALVHRGIEHDVLTVRRSLYGVLDDVVEQRLEQLLVGGDSDILREALQSHVILRKERHERGLRLVYHGLQADGALFYFSAVHGNDAHELARE